MRINDLIIEPGQDDHIARHRVTVDEIRDVVFGDPAIRRERQGYYRFGGQTRGGRYLTVFLAPREPGVFSLVTAREATDAERRHYRARGRR